MICHTKQLRNVSLLLLETKQDIEKFDSTKKIESYKRNGGFYGEYLWHEERKTNPDFAVQTLLEFLELLFRIALNGLLSKCQHRTSKWDSANSKNLEEPGRLFDCITSSNCDSGSAIGSVLVLIMDPANFDRMA